MLRIINLAVILALVLAAAWVYEIKYASTVQFERVAKLRAEIRREHNAIATLRAEWAQLDNPDRVQVLARRHLPLRPIDSFQFDNLSALPDRPVEIVPPGTADPIAAIIEGFEEKLESEAVTGSVPPKEGDQ